MHYYMVDAFASEPFHGNPAGVCLVEEEISDEMMQQIAMENQLPETAFIRKIQDEFELRWFTKDFEIDLCGHATLASAYVLFEECGYDQKNIVFHTKSGEITVKKCKNGYQMKLPLWKPDNVRLSDFQKRCLGTDVINVVGKRDLLVELEDEKAVKEYVPNYQDLQKLSEWLGIIVTAKSEHCDFVSRYFCPELMDEDPVTGSAHSMLVPYWAEKLKKKKLAAFQASKRGGFLQCKLEKDSVIIEGLAVLVMKGQYQWQTKEKTKPM